MPQSTRGRTIWTAGLLAAFSLWTMPAGAQASRVVTTSLGVSAFYDENIFWQADAQSDHVWRLTPRFALQRDSVRSHLQLEGLMDAEWYSRQRSLSTGWARQHASSSWTFKPTDVDTVRWSAGYDNSVNASQINVGTGLFLGRLRAWRWFAAPVYERALGPRTSLSTGYRVTSESAEDLPGVVTHAGEFAIIEDVDDRNQLRPSYTAERFEFGGRLAKYSHRGVFEWTRRVSSSLSTVVGAGARVIGTSVTPEIALAIDRRNMWTTSALSYSWGRVTTIGVDRLIEVHSLVASVRRSRPSGANVSLTGSAYRNRIDERVADVYHLGTVLGSPAAHGVSIVLTTGVDYQRGRVGGLLDPVALITPSGVVALGPPGIRRSTAMVSIVVTHIGRSAAGPPDRPKTDAPPRERPQ